MNRLIRRAQGRSEARARVARCRENRSEASEPANLLIEAAKASTNFRCTRGEPTPPKQTAGARRNSAVLHNTRPRLSTLVTDGNPTPHPSDKAEHKGLQQRVAVASLQATRVNGDAPGALTLNTGPQNGTRHAAPASHEPCQNIF